MVITKETAQYVAQLSRLKISEDEIESVCGSLTQIIGYMDEINSSVDTASVDTKVGALTNVMRVDEIKPSADRAELLANSPEHTDETPIVPKTVE